jgi:hypothetical protein
MPKLLISYRRSDSDAMAGRIRDNLAAYYGNDAVFIDVDNIPIGTDFRDHIRKAFGDHDMLIAVVGQKWLGQRKGGRTRIQEETDPVRVEIEMALQKNMPVVPVLVNGARMPKPQELPDSIKAFSFRNAAEIDSGRDFRHHMDGVIRSIDSILGADARKTYRPGRSPSRSRILLWALGCAALVLIGVAGLFAIRSVEEGFLQRTPPAKASTHTGTISDNSGAASIQKAASPAAAISCSQEKSLRSLSTNIPTSITFTNTTPAIVRIYWLNHNGDRVLYGTLSKGQVLSQQTYITHPWVVTDSSDRCEAIYMPTPDPQYVNIN